MLKRTVKPGNVRDGFNLTGNSGTSASPTNATQTKATISVKAEAFGDLFISDSIILHYHHSYKWKSSFNQLSPIEIEPVRKRKLRGEIEQGKPAYLIIIQPVVLQGGNIIPLCLLLPVE